MAAYLAIKDNPTKIPKIKKLKKFGFFFIFRTCKRLIDHKKISMTSVVIKKEDTVTAGMR